MSHDGSSAKSYIRHATEKERLDNLAFASFPEDYLPYAAAQGHNRAAAPPYLLWGEDRRRRPNKRRRNPRCAGALLCAIALVVVAILAVVAISVYLGVVTNLFRSPVVSVSGSFIASEEFSEELLNSTSSQFLEKADIYQSKVEKAFLSSSLEPSFIAARIYSFRPGLIVFFRVYLDRRKLGQDNGATEPKELVRELVVQKLTQDPNSVHVQENEDLLSGDTRSTEKIPTTNQLQPTAQTPSQPQPPSSGGVGEWRPVPIEDSVSPSFGDGAPQGGLGTVRSPEEITRNPSANLGSVRVEELTPQRNPPTLANPQRNTPSSANPQRNQPTLVNPQIDQPTDANQQEGVGSVRVPGMRNSLTPATRREGAGSVRFLEETHAKNPSLSANPLEGVGSVRLLDDVPILPENDGVGSVRLLDEAPKRNTQSFGVSRAGVGLVRVLEENPIGKPPSHRLPDGIRGMEQPPTLAPSVSLVVRNRSRSDKPRNSAARLDKSQQDDDSVKTQNIGVGSIREIITEVDNFPLPPHIEAAGISSRLLELDLDKTTESKVADKITTEVSTEKEDINNQTLADKDSSEATASTRDDLALHNSTENLKLNDQNENNAKTDVSTFGDIVNSEITTLSEESVDGAVTEQKPQEGTKIRSPLDIIFSHAQDISVTTVNVGIDSNTEFEKSAETSSRDNDTDMKVFGSVQNQTFTIESTSNKPEEAQTQESVTVARENLDAENIHSSIVNHSQYPNPEPHYHTIEKENNMSSIESFKEHTLEGHGFHKPLNTSQTLKETSSSLSSNASSLEIYSSLENQTSLSANVSISEVEPSTENKSSLVDNASEVQLSTEITTLDHILEELSTELSVILLETNSSNNESVQDAEHMFTPEYSEISSNISLTFGEVWTDDDDAGNITTEDNSQQAKVVPQLQSHLLSNDIEGEEESGDEGLFEDPFQEEILRHITTIKPRQNGTDAQSCLFGQVPCSVSGDGCGVRCDMRKDCPDNEDEHGCTCSDLLRAMGQSQKVCDGVDDCSDGSDESDCPWCPSAGHFRCPGSRTCITLDRVCDGLENCPGAQDEKHCVSLADSSVEAESPEYRRKGYLVVRRNGRWGKLCLDSLSQSPDLDRRTKELGRAVCTALTYRNMSSSIRTRDQSESEDSYYQISADTANNRSASSLFEPSPCERREVLRVQCESLECGLRPSAPPTQRRRIVGGRSAEAAGAWPWAAALYREGDFQCGAALISDHWLVSAAHCFYSSQGAHWVARLGVLRRGSELQSSWEQVRRIQDIILHPEYEDVGFINDISLLKMERPVPFSDSLRPICLPSSASEDASLWHGRRCSVVGWGKLYEIGHTFPDSLQEVRLPVISSAECQRRSLFLPAYRITPKMFCAGYERGGRDACLGDSGGPMACQRPADGRWLLLGVTSNGDGCGRPNRPGVYTQVAGYLSWLRDVTLNQKVFNRRTGSESTCPGGVRCRLGRCIQQLRVCDGRRDCAAGEDEDNC